MKTQNTYQSRIATIVYANFTENVDLNAHAGNQAELDALVLSDKSIIRVDYYIGGVLQVPVKVSQPVVAAPAKPKVKKYTEKQALSQCIKMNSTIAKIYDKMEDVFGRDWWDKENRNNKRNEKISELTDKIEFYKQFILTEEGYYESGLASDMCQPWEEFKGIYE